MVNKQCCWYFLVLMFSLNVTVSAKVAQSLVVTFPTSGRVIVHAKEEVGQFPVMLFTAEKSGKVLLEHPIKDKDKWLIPEKDDLSPPNLRFRLVQSKGFSGPMIMSVGVYHGGSDDAFFLTVFGEVGGEIKSLNDKPIFANIQGGYYLGFLNEKYGYGLATWNFIWGHAINESHYSAHKYEAELYVLKDGKFSQILHRISRKMHSGNGSGSLREIGITVFDQRKGIPKIKDALD